LQHFLRRTQAEFRRDDKQSEATMNRVLFPNSLFILLLLQEFLFLVKADM
jgi:hypothetical protein